MTTDLIKRLTEAEEGSRELDILFARATIPAGWRICDGGSVECYGDMGNGDDWYPSGSEAPHYTTNLQDAVSAVPEGAGAWHVGFAYNGGPYDARVFMVHRCDAGRPVEEYDFYAIHPHSAPLALCIAILRALEAKDE